MATQNVPAVGEKFYPCFESELLAKKTTSRARSLKPLKIEQVFHETRVPAGLARTWCIKIGDTCYDAAWSERARAWVFGGANSGMKA